MENYTGLIAVFREGDILTTQDIADRVGRSVTTAFRLHLERCVSRKLLTRSYGWTGRGQGWLYFLPSTIAPYWKELD